MLNESRPLWTSNRRTRAGGKGQSVTYLIPTERPEIVTSSGGPAVFHSDLTPVTAAKPAKAGETLISMPMQLQSAKYIEDSPRSEVGSPLRKSATATQQHSGLLYEMSVVLLDVLDDQSQLLVVKVLIDRKYSLWKG